MNRFLSSIIARIRGLPPPLLYAAAAVLVAGFAVAGVLAYRTWDYVEHDNDFCMSCHLMQDPFERFAQSEHRGLGCKACHNPTLVGRSRMALTQILENPEAIEEHAEVPNENCTSCHVDGDPERWTLISRSTGHRVHLESDAPELEDVRCVECHSSGIHEFAATDQTCGQAGCHEDVEIRLGRMGDLTIHCVACHDFSRPVQEPTRTAGGGGAGGPVSEVAAPLRPQANECLSCHAMRMLVGELPEDEPHGGVCGACHNPHEQTTPAQAVESCATGGCHSAADTLTPMHRGLAANTLEQCTLCHSPHDAPIEDVTCTNCHADGARIDRGETILPRGVGDMPRTAAHPAATRAATPAGSGDDGGRTFAHQQHGTLECASCHVSTEEHGAVTATTLRECRECHHDPANVSQVQCTRCHTEGASRDVHHVARTMDMSTGDRRRGLPLVHAQHGGLECVRCHTEGAQLSAARVDCSACHSEHHRPQAVCRSCHVDPPDAAHPLVVHTGCAGSGCHTAVPFRSRPDTREFCLACHQDLVRHEPGQVCTACHAMPEWGGTVRP